MTTKTVQDPNKKKISFGAIIAVVIAIILVLVFAIVSMSKKSSDSDSDSDSGWSFANSETIKELSVEYEKDNKLGESINFSVPEKVDGNKEHHVIDLYEEPQCPACLQLAENFGSEINQAVKNGNTLKIHAMTFLDDRAESTYSKEVVSALISLAKNGEVETAWKIYSTMYSNYPQAMESDVDLASVMRDAGASDNSIQEYTKGKDEDEFLNANNSNFSNFQVLKDVVGSAGTPTVMVDGVEYDVPNDWLEILGL